MTAKRTVTLDGVTFYKVKSDKIEIPDFTQMGRFDALSWMCRHTYPRGYSKGTPALPVVNLVVRGDV